jgi:hypothetical protein
MTKLEEENQATNEGLDLEKRICPIGAPYSLHVKAFVGKVYHRLQERHRPLACY